jgi:hypothetical protein
MSPYVARPLQVSERTYKVTKGGSEERGRGVNYRLGLPPRLGERIPEDTRFRLEVTRRGLLYIPDQGWDVDLPFLDNGNGDHA